MKLINQLKQAFTLWKRKREIKRVSKIADDLHKVNGKRYFVIQYGDEMKVIDNIYIQEYNKLAKKQGVKQMRFIDVINTCLYATPVATTNKRK